MFRDPTFFFAFREKVVPALRTYPFSRLWVAGCSTGEEVLLARDPARRGRPRRPRPDLRDRHQRSGDRDRRGSASSRSTRCRSTRRTTSGPAAPARSPSTTSRATTARSFARALVDGVVFARHNLASDAAFNEFNVITCRNVMIYFAQPLQEHVHRLFYESLATFGVLALGQKETIRFSPHESCVRGARRRRAALTRRFG